MLWKKFKSQLTQEEYNMLLSLHKRTSAMLDISFSEEERNTLISIWNEYSLLLKNNWHQWFLGIRRINDKIKKTYTKRKQILQFDEDDFRRAVSLYYERCLSFQHRWSIYDFIKQENALEYFMNLDIEKKQEKNLLSGIENY